MGDEISVATDSTISVLYFRHKSYILYILLVKVDVVYHEIMLRKFIRGVISGSEIEALSNG